MQEIFILLFGYSVYTIGDVFEALYVMFSDNKIPYPGRPWKNQEDPGTHKAVHISLLAVSTTYDVTRETERCI